MDKNIFVKLMRPVFYVGDWIAGQYEDLFPNWESANTIGWKLEYLATFMAIMFGIMLTIRGEIVLGIINIMTGIFSNYAMHGSYRRINDTAFRAVIRSDQASCFQLMVLIIFSIYYIIDVSVNGDFFKPLCILIETMILTGIGGLLLFLSNPIPPKRKEDFSFAGAA